MTTEALLCPSCRAPGPTGPNAEGEYLCIYCGTRFHRNTAAPQASAPAPTPVVVNVMAPGHAAVSSRAPVAVIAIGVTVLAAAVAGFVVLSVGKSDDETSSASARARPARSNAVSVNVPAIQPADAPEATHTPPTSVSAPAIAPEAPPPEPPATATFDFHRTQAGYQTSFYALGYVTNTSPFVIDKPKINAVLIDAEGKEVGTDFGYASRDVLAPDERSPIKILIKDPPAHAEVRYEIVVRKASYIPTFAEGLRIEPGPAKPAQFGKHTWDLEGKVFNDGTRGAKFVQIEIQALDANGKLVGIGETFADGEVLSPGGSARYKTSLMLADAPDHFEFSVNGRVED